MPLPGSAPPGCHDCDRVEQAALVGVHLPNREIPPAGRAIARRRMVIKCPIKTARNAPPLSTIRLASSFQSMQCGRSSVDRSNSPWGKDTECVRSPRTWDRRRCLRRFWTAVPGTGGNRLIHILEMTTRRFQTALWIAVAPPVGPSPFVTDLVLLLRR
jgi:hypothetical protein